MMARDESESMDRLNNEWDRLVKGKPIEPDGLEESYAETIRRIHALDDAPAPDSVFAAGLWRKLVGQPDPAKAKKTRKKNGFFRWPFGKLGFPGPRRLALRLAIAVMLVALIFGVTLIVKSGPGDIPTVVAFEPDMVRGVPVLSPITIQFSTEMDRSSVERAFKITPEVPGEVSWHGNALTFTPVGSGYKRGTKYTVSIESSAQSSKQQRLPSAFEASFAAAENLSVLSVQPFRDSSEVGTDSIISVQFNNPIAPLTTLDAPQIDPLVITPAVAGQGKWLTSSVYTFRPTAGLEPSTQYTVTVKKGTADSTGSALTADYTWTFRTWAPAVVTVSPAASSSYVWVSAPISVTFNQPVDHASAQSRFHLTGSDGNDIAGSFAWPSDSTVVFTPGQQLSRAAKYIAKVDAGLKGAKGSLGMAKEFVWSFTTVDIPRVVSITPANGSSTQAYSQITIQFNQPMDKKSVLDNLDFLPKPTHVYTNWIDSDTRLMVSGVITQPSTHYRITLNSAALDRYGQRLAEGKTSEFDTDPLPPSINLRVPGMAGAFNLSPSGTAYALVDAVNIDEVRLGLYAADKASFIAADSGQGSKQPDQSGKALRQWTIPVKAALNETKVISVPLSTADGQAGLAPGIYMVQVENRPADPNQRVGGYGPYQGLLIVSRAVATLKATSDQALVWVVDQVSGEPVKDSQVTLVDQSNQTIASGKTDANGLYSAKFSALAQDRIIYVFAEKDGDIAAASTNWNWTGGISPFSFNLSYRYSGPNYAVALYTDRPIYRPGDKIYYKGVARADDDGKYSLLPSSKPAIITIRDPQYRPVFSQTVPLDEYGSFDGEFSLESEAVTGNYSIQVAFDQVVQSPSKMTPPPESYSMGFLVAEFRKPDFEVKVAPDKNEYIQGDDVVVTVNAGYFFGAPLANAKVNWQVFQRPYSFQGPKDIVDGPYSFSDYEPSTFGPTITPGPKPIASGEGKTDANGLLTFRLRADIAKETMGQVFTFEATVTDANNQQVSGRGEAAIHKGTYYIGVRPNPRVVTAGKAAGVDLLTVDTKAAVAPNKTVNIDLLEQKWYSVQEKGPDGRFYWTSKVESTLISSTSATTDASGKATASIVPPKAGSYKILATAKDERGNEIRSSTFVYASGSDYVYWRVDNNDRIELITDKPSYKPGETAKVLVPSPFPKAKALVTVERGHIMDYRTIDITSSSQIVEIPIDSSHIPNTFVSIVIVRSEADGNGKADFKVGYVELPVQADEKKLSISITPDKTKYQPRETVTYKVKTTDYQGKPAQAELSLALVDASVLSLADEKVRDMFDSFYGRRAVNVRTAQTLSKSLNKVDPAAFGLGKGGGGEPEDTRGFFPDVAYWNAKVTTDKNGEATVSVPLPDTLTTWRLTARGTTKDTIVGTQTNDIVVSKEVIIRPAIPRFLTVGDEATLEAVVHNYTSDSIDADISLAAEGVTLSSQASQRAKIAPAGTARVVWAVKAGNASQAKLTFKAEPVSPSGAPRDIVETSLPILTYLAPEITASSGEVKTTITQTVQLPSTIDRQQGELTIKMEPSLASGMQDGLKYLESYPYECVEQTISRFLPNILTLRALDKLGTDNAELRDKLPQLVSQSIQRLYSAQNPDGSWGWWPRDAGNPFITAYALYGLNEAKREGFAVQQQVMDNAAKYLTGYLASNKDVNSPENPNLRAYILYVLAEAGKGDNSTTIALYERRDSLENYGRAYLAMALYVLNNGQADNRVNNLIEDLTSSAVASATGVHWEEVGYDFRTMNTNNRTTAIVLDALVRTDPTNELIPGAVRWLMVSRSEGHWETTQETAMSVLALSDYLAASGELKANYSYEVAINGTKIGDGKVSKASLDAEKSFEIDIPQLLVDEANNVRMSRYPSPGEQSVGGKLFYSLYLRYFLPAQNIQARNEGIAISREYLDANGQPVKDAKVGSTLKVKLTIVAPQDLHYVVVEDPLPAGAEAVDPALKTTSLASLTSTADQWRFSRIDIRDEKVAFFATYLPKGTYEYTYLIHLTSAGNYQVLPVGAHEMYFPEVWGRGAGGTMAIRPE